MSAVSLADIVKALHTAEENVAYSSGHACIIYGEPKTGKTALAASAAESDELDRVFWFDNENGWETLVWMVEKGKLSMKAAAKITIININDTVDSPLAVETMIRALNSVKAPVYIRPSDGKLLPSKPKDFDDNTDVIEFQMSKLTRRDLVVMDSLSQLGDSTMAATMLNRSDIKPEWDDYAAQGKKLGDMLSIVQRAKYTNFICVTHPILLPANDGNEKFFPMCGTRAFCHKVAKYFGTVVATGVKLNKHVAGSSSTYSKQYLTGSRRGIVLEKMDKPNLACLFSKEAIDFEKLEEKTKPSATPNKGGSLLRKNLGR